jgi:hypothetical protein
MDELIGEDIAQHRRTMRLVRAVLANAALGRRRPQHAERPLGSAACDSVFAVAFAADGKTLATDCNNGKTLLWSGVVWTSDADLQTEVCDLVWRSLTPAEWSALAPGLPYRASCQT